MERYLTAKELSAVLEELGIHRTESWIRAVWRHSGAPSLQYREAKLSDFLAWLESTPNTATRPRDPKRLPMQIV